MLAILVVATLVSACQSSLLPSNKPDQAYHLTSLDGKSHGVVHLIKNGTTNLEWVAWWDWQEGGISQRSGFSATILHDTKNNVSAATISRVNGEVLQLTALPDRLHGEVSLGSKPTVSFDIPTNGASFFIPPGSGLPSSGDILCFDPFSWDYILLKATSQADGNIILTKDNQNRGFIQGDNEHVLTWSLPLTAVSKGNSFEFDKESVPLPVITPTTLNQDEVSKIAALTLDFELTQPHSSSWQWLGPGEYSKDNNAYQGAWEYTPVTANKNTLKTHKEMTPEKWDMESAILPSVKTDPKHLVTPKTIPSTPLSALLRGEGDDNTRAWLAASFAHQQGWKSRLVGGIVLRPNRDYSPVFTTWAEALIDDQIQILDTDVANGISLRLWTDTAPVSDYSGKIRLISVRTVNPANWRSIPPVKNGESWQWELVKDEALIGKMNLSWHLDTATSQPSVSVIYQGDSMGLPFAGNLQMAVNQKGYFVGYLGSDFIKSQYYLLAYLKGWALCPLGSAMVPGLAVYFTGSDDNSWLPALMWTDGSPAAVREAGEGTYTDGREFRTIKRYHIEPPGLLVSVGDGGELLEVMGEFGIWHRINLPIRRANETYLPTQ